jgi:hypothetical protein
MVTNQELTRATNCRCTKLPQGMIGSGELESNSFPSKPLIRKKQVIWRNGGQVRIELHSTR